jgi:RimJ/RimL family protein N-acetyltransferase
MSDASSVLAKGRRLHLRRLEAGDVGAAYLRWMNDPNVTRFLESRFRPWTQADLIAFVEADLKAKSAISFAVCINADDRHIGNIRISKFDAPHLNGSVGLLIGEDDCRGKGYGTEAIELTCHYAFETLRLHRLTAGCYDTNKASIAAFLKAGFEEEGRQRDRWMDGDTCVDGVILGMTRSNWTKRISQNTRAAGSRA